MPKTIENKPPKTAESLIGLRGVSIGYGGIPVVRNIDIDIIRGEFLGIIGPNGSGKSTLLKGMLGLVPILSGSLALGSGSGHDAGNIRGFFGYVPQRSQIDQSFPTTVLETVLMGQYGKLGLFKRAGKVEKAAASKALDLVGMSGFEPRPIGWLSGGQLQRVLIARALVSSPKVLVLDEPTSAVDVAAEQSILALLDKLNREHGLTIIMVTHNVNEIVHMAHRLAVLNGGLEALGPPREVLSAELVARVFGGYVQVCAHGDTPLMIVGDGLV